MRVEGKPGKWADLEPSTRKVSNDKKKKKNGN